MNTELNTLRAVGEKIHNPGTKVSRKAQMKEFPDKNVRYDAIERRTIIDEEHPDVCTSVFKVLQSFVKCCSNGIFSRPVDPISKLVGVKGGREAGFNMPQNQSL